MMPPRPFGAPRVSLGVVPPFAALEEMFGIVMVLVAASAVYVNAQLFDVALLGVFRTPDSGNLRRPARLGRSRK